MINNPPFFGTIYSRAREPEIFTSFMFPFYFDEQFQVNTMGFSDRHYMFPLVEDSAQIQNIGMVSGDLIQVIRYITYDHPWVEEVTLKPFAMLDSTLTTVIAYKTLNAPDEEFQVDGVNILSGTLQVVIAYVNYTTQPNEERIEVQNVGILNGTLG